MNPRKLCVLVIFLLLFVSLYAGNVEGYSDGTNTVLDLYKGGGVEAKSRKLLGLQAVLDYDYAGPNPKHDPRGKRGGKNP